MDAGDPIDEAGRIPRRGSGSESVPAAPNTRDVRLLAMALEERWIIDPAAREAAVRRLEAVVRDPESKDRAFQRALKSLVSLGRLNLTAIGVGLSARSQEELEGRVRAIEGRLEERGDHE
jgi:hypothetical protein